MINAAHLSKRYGRHQALEDVSFEARPGRVVGLLGPNGAGKSTTMRIIAGLIPPTGGAATIDGLDSVADSLEVRQRLGYLPEHPPLYPEMRVRSYLRFRARLFGLAGARARDAIDRVLDDCWLREVAHRRIGHLSKGFRQRVGLAAALLHDPPVIMLDEPTSGLDPAQIAETRRLIRGLGAERTVLFSSHILPEVEATCDDAVIIARGRVLARGTLEELRAQGAGAACIVETRVDNPCALLGALPGVEGVDELRTTDGWSRLAVQASESTATLRERIAGAVAEAGGTIRELRDEEASLERLYMRVLEGAAPHAPTEGAAA
ncbi:MAG: ABC transporter ATP-binding protein [Phycisphaerales bacterium]